MERVREWILVHKKLVVTMFFSVMVLCICLWPFVKVNYNMVDYLPEGAQSTEALALMEQEFAGGVPGTRVLVKDVSVQEALEYKERLKETEGVETVLWLDDTIDLKTPLEMADPAAVETYYKDGNALFSLAIEKGMEGKAVEAIYEIIGEDNAAAGDAVTTASAQKMAFSECLRAILLLMPIILLILILSTESWLEPLLFLAAIGVSVLINMGTNVLFGEISFVTQSVSPILQLAVSLDYAIFLLHSFSRHRKDKEGRTEFEAMKLAMKESFTSISASAATTLFGFLALTFMKFQIGVDLGVNLVKGIILSFLSVMFFLPALTLCFCKWIDKTRHRSFLPRGSRLGKWILKARIPVGILALLLLVPCYLAQGRTEFTYGMGTMPDSIRSGRDERMISAEFGESNPFVLLVPRGDVAREKELAENLEALPAVTSVLSYAGSVGTAIPPEYLPESITSQFYSEHYSRLIIYGDVAAEGEEAFRLVEAVQAEGEALYGEDVHSLGMSVNLYDMKHTVERDNKLVNLLAVLSIGLVLLVTFKSITLPLLLLLTIETAIFINLAVPYFTGSSLCYIGYLVINTVQLGATVDYAILFTDTYRTNKKKAEVKMAMKKTIGDVFFSILVSGAIMTASGLCLYFTSTNPIVSSMGMLLGRGTILSMLMVLGFLPALLILFDKVIEKTTWKKRTAKATAILLSVALAGGAAGFSGGAGEVLAAGNVQSDGEAQKGGEGKDAGTVKEKDEVVYASLEADGSVSGVYVVNCLEVEEPGEIQDFGDYSEVKNLTDTSALSYEKGMVSGTAEKGRFYYQGNLSQMELPWNLSVDYKLDGKTVTAEEAAGKSGHLELSFSVKKGNTGDLFYDNYMLQISMSLDTALCRNIQAEGAMAADAGQKKQLTFTALPGKDASYTVSADVEAFQMDGISIAAVPFSMAFELPDLDGMTSQLGDLSGGIEILSEGAEELKNGAKDLTEGAEALKGGSDSYEAGLDQFYDGTVGLNSGAMQFRDGLAQLRDGAFGLDTGMEKYWEGLEAYVAGMEQVKDGSGQYRTGIEAVAGQSGTLKEGSQAVKEGLTLMSETLKEQLEGGIGEIDISVILKLLALPGNLRDFADGLSDVKAGIDGAITSFDSMFAAMDAAVLEIPEIDEAAIAALGTDNETVNQLVAGYRAAKKVKETYEQFRQEAGAMGTSFQTMSDAIGDMETSMRDTADQMETLISGGGIMDMVSGITELSDGLATLAAQYGTFHEGLCSYADGVGALAGSYGELDEGIGQTADGAAGLRDGFSQLDTGMSGIARGLGSTCEGFDSLLTGIGSLTEGAGALVDGYGQLNTGIGEIAAGTGAFSDGLGSFSEGIGELHLNTKDMPEQVQAEIDALLAQYDKSDFIPRSFVSERNENVALVQFVISTAPVHIEPEEETEEEPEEEKTILDRFFDLFR